MPSSESQWKLSYEDLTGHVVCLVDSVQCLQEDGARLLSTRERSADGGHVGLSSAPGGGKLRHFRSADGGHVGLSRAPSSRKLHQFRSAVSVAGPGPPPGQQP